MIDGIPDTRSAAAILVDNALAVYGERLSCARQPLRSRWPAMSSPAADEIPPGGRKIVRLEGREVGIFNLEGTFYALKNVLPSPGRPRLPRQDRRNDAAVRCLRVPLRQEGRILRCPWHEWEYDIATGESVFDPTVQVKTYEVEVREDQVIVTVD